MISLTCNPSPKHRLAKGANHHHGDTNAGIKHETPLAPGSRCQSGPFAPRRNQGFSPNSYSTLRYFLGCHPAAWHVGAIPARRGRPPEVCQRRTGSGPVAGFTTPQRASWARSQGATNLMRKLNGPKLRGAQVKGPTKKAAVERRKASALRHWARDAASWRPRACLASTPKVRRSAPSASRRSAPSRARERREGEERGRRPRAARSKRPAGPGAALAV
jgi:hypothetical protein